MWAKVLDDPQSGAGKKRTSGNSLGEIVEKRKGRVRGGVGVDGRLGRSDRGDGGEHDKQSCGGGKKRASKNTKFVGKKVRGCAWGGSNNLEGS